ncbi:unnamed protein product [Prunus armeniaca]
MYIMSFLKKGCDNLSCALSKLRVDRSNCHKKSQIDEGSQRQQSSISQKSRSNCHKKELSNISRGRLFKRKKKNPKTTNIRKIQRQKKARKKGSKKLTPPIEKQKNFKENRNQSRKKTQKLIQNETTQNKKISSY